MRSTAGIRPGRARLAAFLLVLAIGVTVYLITSRALTYSIDTGDIVGHLFQAKVFAMGKLYAPAPPIPEAFETACVVVDDGKMYSRFEPGHCAVLALGLLLFHSFKVTLGVLAALNAFLVYRTGIALWHDRTVAVLALVVLLLSPFFILDSSTELPQPSSLMWNALFLLALLLALRDSRWQTAFLTGLVLGCSFNTRPLEALGFALPGALLLAWRAVGVAPARRLPFLRLLGTGRRLVALAAFTLGFALLLGVNLAYNRALTGDPLLTPRQKYNSIWGVVEQVSLEPIDSPSKFLNLYYNRHLYVMSVLADHLFPVAMGFQILLALFLLIARDRGSRLLVAILLVQPLPFLMFNWHGNYYNTGQIGPRFLFPLMLPLALMTGKFATELHRWLVWKWPGKGHWAVAAALAYLGIEGAVRADLPHWVAWHHGTTRWRAALREQVLPPPGERALVFISCRQLGERDGMFWNHPSLRGEVVFVRDRGLMANLELQRSLYPDHPIYLGKIRVDAQSFISSWDLLGPFDGPFPQSLDQSWIDESRADAPLPRGLAATWRLYRGDLPLVDFLAAFARNPIDNAVAYARATIHADTEMPVTLRYGSDDGIAIWLNGERLVHEPVWRAAELDQGTVEARLRAGANLLLVKVNQVWCPWQFVLRVTDERGDRPPGLTCSTPLLDGAP